MRKSSSSMAEVHLIDVRRQVRRVSLHRLTMLLAASAFFLWTAPLEAVHLRGQIVRVGYSGSSSDAFVSTGDIYRPGRWTPVCVELSNDDGDQFEGVVEVRQADADGDEVVATREVAVRGMRQFCLYVPGGPITQDNFVTGAGYEGPAPFTVRIFDREGRLADLHDDKGEPVKELQPSRQVIAASADALLILDMSSPPVNYLDRLKALERLQDFTLLRCAPRDLPDSVAGLELADVIVWDSPDPGTLDPLQNEALLEWVHRGGRLIIGVSKNWNELSQSKFGPVLPARLTGTTVTAEPEMLSVLQPAADASEAQPEPLLKPLTYCPLTTAGLANDATALLPRSPGPQEQLWIVRRPCGRGEIILLAAELKDVLSLNAKDESMRLLRADLLRLRLIREPKDGAMFHTGVDVFSPVASQTAFQTTTGIYFIFAFAFAIGYIVLVTGGAWGWLYRHGQVRHAWVASALLSIAVSAVSLGAVQIVRLWGQGVHEMTIVDGRAGAFDAVATSYLGLKTASHTLLDVCVPQQWVKASESPELRGSLRPYAVEDGSGQELKFSVPQRYESVAQIGELRAVPFRATLKQFSATWRGPLDGRISASLRNGPQSSELDPSSWIKNELGTDLQDCYLFTRAASGFVHVYAIPTLADGERVDWTQVCRNMEEEQKKGRAALIPVLERARSLEGDEKARWSPPTLEALLDQCLNQLGSASTRSRQRGEDQDVVARGVAPYIPSLLVLTFFDHPSLAGLLQEGQRLFRSQGRELELSGQLDGRTALFVGFSQSPGPLRLCRRKPGAGIDAWKPIVPSRSAVMYRFTVPIQ